MKKKISFVIGSLSPGGAERVVTTLANELSKSYSVYIITLAKSEPYYPISENVKILCCKERIAPSKNPLQALAGNFNLFKKISSIVKKEKIELLIGFITSANILTILASKKNGIPCIISERNFPAHSETPEMWKVLRKLLYRLSDFLVVQTEEIRDYFKSYISNKRIIILPNPIAPEITELVDLNSKKDKIILNVGRLAPQKSQDTLIKAFSNIDDKGWRIIIIGEGSKRKDYESLIGKLNLENKVHLVGNTNDMPFYYNMASIFAFTSKYEGFPNALLEAMHFGIASISTDCPTGPAKLLKDGQNGFLIPVDSQKQLEERLSTLISNESLRKELGNQAIKSTVHFQTGPVTNQWKDVIKKLI